jgi:hypothetical protein
MRNRARHHAATLRPAGALYLERRIFEEPGLNAEVRNHYADELGGEFFS